MGFKRWVDENVSLVAFVAVVALVAVVAVVTFVNKKLDKQYKAQFISLCWAEASVDLDVWLLCRAETYLLACNPFINKLGA
jgi:uncharacterized membrane protein